MTFICLIYFDKGIPVDPTIVERTARMNNFVSITKSDSDEIFFRSKIIQIKYKLGSFNLRTDQITVYIHKIYLHIVE